MGCKYARNELKQKLDNGFNRNIMGCKFRRLGKHLWQAMVI